MSRLWGYVNSLELPVWLRPYGFKLFAYTFGCNLEEVEYDLPSYISLGDFFYRRLKPGSRPVADALLVSPADGRMLHFGRVDVNGVTQANSWAPYRLNKSKDHIFIGCIIGCGMAGQSGQHPCAVSQPGLGDHQPSGICQPKWHRILTRPAYWFH